MKFYLVESFESFEMLYNRILPNELKVLNDYLDTYGFEVELIDEYDDGTELYNDAVGIFCNELQDSADTFPIFINKDLIYKLLSETNEEDDYQSVRDAIKGTLWHEAGHGICNYIADIYYFDNEEEMVEDFARYGDNCELIDTLKEYLRKIDEK